MANEKSKYSTVWKDFLIKHKWMPKSVITKQFGIKDHDIDNFRRKPDVRVILAPWQISHSQTPENLRRIFQNAWRYYLTEVEGLDLLAEPRDWVPQLLALKIEKSGSGFSFLTDSRYFKIICPSVFNDFSSKGFTRIALATFEFWPGRAFLLEKGVLPYMFLQTGRKILDHVDVDNMIEHIYLNFIAEPGTVSSPDMLYLAKERFILRHNEPSFVSASTVEKFGIPYNFYKDGGGLRATLRKIAEKYRIELGIAVDSREQWSKGKFQKLFPERELNRCEYCHSRPVDLHHLLPRSEHPNLTFDGENVVPLCLPVHAYITRNKFTQTERNEYDKAISSWSKERQHEKRRAHFQHVMELLHSAVQGSSTTMNGSIFES